MEKRKQDRISLLIVSTTATLAIGIPSVLQIVEKRPDLETPIFLLAGVAITGVINFAVAQIQTWSTENRDERNTIIAREDRILELRREALQKRIAQAEKSMQPIAEDFFIVDEVSREILGSYSRGKPLNAKETTDLLNKGTASRQTNIKNLNQINLPLIALGDNALRISWNQILEIHRKLHEVNVEITNGHNTFIQDHEDQLSATAAELEKKVINVSTQFDAACGNYLRRLDEIWTKGPESAKKPE